MRAAYDITRVKRHQMRWENETSDETANGAAKETAKETSDETGIYTHEQIVAKHQCFTPRTIKRS